MNNRWRRIAKHVDKSQIIIMYGGGLGYPEIMISGIGTVTYHDCNFYKTSSFRRGKKNGMQDRFKFRAWDTEKGRYVSDEEICYETGGEWDSIYDLVIDDDPYYIPEQCTGLKDKNGKLIYEGDIVKYHVIKKTSFPIEREVLAFKAKKVTFKKGHFNPVFNLDLNDVEIIGNIHESPELLEEKQC